MSRRFGEEFIEKLIEPLMAGIYGGDGSQLSLKATFPKLREMEKQYGSVIEGLKKTSSQEPSSLAPFVSFPNGMSRLIEALQKKLDGVDILLNAKVWDLNKISEEYKLSIDSESLPPHPDPLPRGERESSSQGEWESIPSPLAGEGRGEGADFKQKCYFRLRSAFISKNPRKIFSTLSDLHKAIPYGSSVLVNLVFKKSDRRKFTQELWLHHSAHRKFKDFSLHLHFAKMDWSSARRQHINSSLHEPI